MNAVHQANAVNERAASDHGRPLIWLHNIALVDVRADFPDAVPPSVIRPRPPDLVRFMSVHHDVVFYPDDPLTGDDFPAELARMTAVYRYHGGLGWGGIGYHTYGFPSGRLYLVGDLDTQRANVARRNHESIGHCAAGDFTTRVPSIAQQLVAAMAAIVCFAHLRRLIAVQSHHDVALPGSPTACCGDTRDQWVPQLPRAIVAIARQRVK